MTISNNMPREGSREIDKGILISEFPDYCRSQEAIIPYIIHAFQRDSANTAPTVRMTRKRAHSSASIITCCHGNEAGVGLGVKSGTKESVCQPKTWSKTVRIEGNYAVRHNDTWWMNNTNTTGKMQYIRDLSVAPPTTPLQHPPKRESDENMPPPRDSSLFFTEASRQAAASGQTVMSDAAPNSLMSGALYAQAALVPNAVPTPAGPTPTSAPTPSPNVPGTVIRPNIPQWQRPPLPPKTLQVGGTDASRWWNLASAIRLISTPSFIGTFFWAMQQTTLADGTFTGHFRIREQRIYDHVSEMRAQGLAETVIENWYNQAWDAYALDYWKHFQHLPPNAQVASSETITPPDATITSENVRVTAKVEITDDKSLKKCPCLVGPYRIVKPVCKKTCGSEAQAHHIIADKTFRLGPRKSATKDQRIPTPAGSNPFPSLNDGAAICLDGQAKVTGTEHYIAHKADKPVEELGKVATIPGIAPLKDIATIYESSAIAARPDCAAQIRAEVAKSLEGIDPNAMGRTTNKPFKRGSAAHDHVTGIEE